MPASSTMALVGSSPKVTGRSRLIPASGPTPGSTPTSVPMRQPANAYSSTPGVSATEKPRYRFWKVSSMRGVLQPEGAARQRHAQQRIEEIERGEREDQREAGGDQHP